MKDAPPPHFREYGLTLERCGLKSPEAEAVKRKYDTDPAFLHAARVMEIAQEIKERANETR